MRLVWALLLSGMTLASQAAQLQLADSWQLLALMPRQSFASHGVALAPGEYQLLVRYEGVIPARSNSEFDETHHSAPQWLRLQIQGDGQLQILDPALADGKAMAAFAKAPQVTLTGEGGQLVITSYSIHYTKLYEGPGSGLWHRRWTDCWADRCRRICSW